MQTLEGLETEINRMRATIGLVSQSMVGTADAMRAVSQSNDQVLKLMSLFDTRLDILTERIDLMAERIKLLESMRGTIRDLEKIVKEMNIVRR